MTECNRTRLREQAVGVIANVLGVPAADVHAAHALLDLGADSYQFSEIVFRLEAMFGVSIDSGYAVPAAYPVSDLLDAVQVAINDARTDGANAALRE